MENGAEIIPKGVINLGQSLSHGCAVPAPFAQGSLRDGGCGLPRRPCGPPRNDNGFLSFRGAERRGNPSFLRWTGVRAAESSAPTEGLPKFQQRADVPKAWPPPTKFRAEIWGVSHRHRPLRKTGKPHRPPGPAAQSGASAAQTGGTGGNRGRDHPKSVQQRQTIPQSAFGRQLPLHKGALPCGGREMRIAASLRSSQ